MNLEDLKGPEDLKGLKVGELNKLAAEIRAKMLETVSQTGGHLAPSLGVVELTLALHTVYDSPKDKIIWDVGHQTYAHKLLTGRLGVFNTLRQFGGISGFPKIAESVHDHFNTGHSSTSIAAATGIALARDQKGQKNSVVAVIGDGALTGGAALEALNYAGDLELDITVILNDNKMSIKKNVGAISSYLNRLRLEPMYEKSKDELGNMVKRIPKIGIPLVRTADKFKEAFKYLVVPGMLFEELNYTYLGPVNGHDISALQKVLESSKHIKGPILIHVYTTKGKGYKHAENNPDKFHGTGPFNLKTGAQEKSSSVPTYTSVFGKTLTQLAAKDKRIVAVTAAMLDGTGLNHFAKKFPDRHYDVGIAEQCAVTMAAGMATQGFIPVVAIYSTFLQRSFDQIIHDVCIQNLPVIFAIDRAGLVGEDGETHHGVFDISYLRMIPNLVLMAPKDEAELQKMLVTAISLNKPVAIRYPRGEAIGVELYQKDIEPLEFQKGETLLKGSDLTILPVGPYVYDALTAAQELKKHGINCTVINPRFLKPLDEKLIASSLNETGRVITIEENIICGGFGSSVIELASKNNIKDLKSKMIGIEDVFITHGSSDLLRKEIGLTSDNIVHTALSMFNDLKRTSR